MRRCISPNAGSGSAAPTGGAGTRRSFTPGRAGKETGDAGIVWEGHKAGREIGYCQIEKLGNLERLPASGFTVSCFPVRIAGASAGWTRAVAIFDEQERPTWQRDDGNDKVIITCAVTGAIHTPSMSDHLPLTPGEVAEQAIGAAEAGASILHLHARDPGDGRPTPDPAVFMEFLPRIKQNTDAVINITTGGGLGMTVEERMAAALAARPEVASLNMGSMNFGIFPAADRVKSWKHDWEEPYLRGTDDFIFRNTFRDIERILKDLGEAHGTRFEFECYDVGHLYNLAHFLDRGLVRPPLFVQTIFRHPGRHRQRQGKPGLHEADRRPPVRRRL